MKLDIGSGPKPLKGFLTVDKNPWYKPDIIVDIENEAIPIKDNIVEEINCSHTLEHIQPIKLDFVISEFWRVLKHDGILNIRLPHFTYAPSEWHYFQPRHDFLKCYYDATNSFTLVSRKLIFGGYNKIIEKYANKHPWTYEHSFLRSIFFVSEIHIVLEANKKTSFQNITGGMKKMEEE